MLKLVAVKQFSLSYYIGETSLNTIYIYIMEVKLKSSTANQSKALWQVG